MAEPDVADKQATVARKMVAIQKVADELERRANRKAAGAKLGFQAHQAQSSKIRKLPRHKRGTDEAHGGVGIPRRAPRL
jgi:hypothetical protein